MFNESDKNYDNKQFTRDFLSLGWLTRIGLNLDVCVRAILCEKISKEKIAVLGEVKMLPASVHHNVKPLKNYASLITLPNS